MKLGWGTDYKRPHFWSSLQCSSSTQLTHERNTLMNDTKFIGLDVHKTSVSAAVLDQDGKLVMQSVFATHAAAILSFIHGLRGTLRVTFEEGTHSTWLYDLLHSQVAEVLVCNPRKNALLKSGNNSDQIYARRLADLLRWWMFAPAENASSGPTADWP